MTRCVLTACVALGLAAFWAGLWMAGHRYSTEFDWRYMTISTLVYPDRNPAGYRWAWGGLTLCALCGLSWTAALIRRRPQAYAERRGSGLWPLALGYAFMGCCILLAGRPLPIPKVHETLSVSAFVCLCIGLVQRTQHVAQRTLFRWAPGLPGGPGLWASVLAGLAPLPIVIAGVMLVYVAQARPELPWVGIEWRVRQVPLYLSFAFWEWTTCAVFSAYTLGVCFATPTRPAVRTAG